MVCWAAPNSDSPLGNDRRAIAIENIEEMKGNKALIGSLEALEKSLKSSSGTLPCTDGAAYKVPILRISSADGDENESDNKGTGDAPAVKKAKTDVAYSTSKGISAAASKGQGPAAASSAAVVRVETYPPSDAVLTRLKKAAVPSPAAVEAASSSSSSTEGSSSKKREVGGDVIDADRVSIDNADWLDKGLKTPMTKILKTLVGDSIDPKSVSPNLVRIQLVGAQGLDWHRETPTDDHIGTLFVVLPLKYKGGKITVRHGDDTWSIDPAKSKSTVRCSWIAFAPEAEVSVEAVTDGATQALLVYHIVGKEKKGKNQSANAEKIIMDKLDQVAERAKPESRINRLGVFLTNKYNPKDFSAASLKGQDRWLYNLLNDSKYEVKLTFVRVLMTAWGFFDSRDCFEPEKRVQMTECGDEFMDSEIWEMDTSKKDRWAPKNWQVDGDGDGGKPMLHPKGHPLLDPNDGHHKCRRLPWEMPWLHKSLFSALPQMTRVDREPLPSWSEGLWLSETYRVAALLISVKPEFKDESDGPYTHFYPVAHPEPRGVSEREDMEWSKPVIHWRLPGDTQEELDELERKMWDRRNWVHQDLD